jgi:phage prohead protease, HK97 family
MDRLMDYLRVRVDGLELKGFDGEGAGEFTGHAAVFGNRDYGGDIIEPGAFTKTLKERKGKAVLLDSHDSRSRVGIVYLDEDSKGLRVVKGVLNLNKQIARDVYEDMKFQSAHDLPLEMSIGYETVKRDIRGDTRHLKEINLIEVSVVTLGMNPRRRSPESRRPTK